MQNHTISEMAKVMERGLMVIPQKIRKMANINEGMYIRVILKSNEITLKPLLYSSDDPMVLPAKVKSKKEGMAILSKIKRPLFFDKDIQFIKKGRKMIEDRLQNQNS
jgi:AbrB family looped-hinge helix DNA binding protein